MVHMASVWVPFTSESKEAIAAYPEIQRELRLGLQAVGRKLGMYLRRRNRVKQEGERRSIFLRYLGEVATAVSAINGTNRDRLFEQLLKVAKRKTSEADVRLDERGKVIEDEEDFGDNVLIVEPDPVDADELLALVAGKKNTAPPREDDTRRKSPRSEVRARPRQNGVNGVTWTVVCFSVSRCWPSSAAVAKWPRRKLPTNGGRLKLPTPMRTPGIPPTTKPGPNPHLPDSLDEAPASQPDATSEDQLPDTTAGEEPEMVPMIDESACVAVCRGARTVRPGWRTTDARTTKSPRSPTPRPSRRPPPNPRRAASRDHRRSSTRDLRGSASSTPPTACAAATRPTNSIATSGVRKTPTWRSNWGSAKSASPTSTPPARLNGRRSGNWNSAKIRPSTSCC